MNKDVSIFVQGHLINLSFHVQYGDLIVRYYGSCILLIIFIRFIYILHHAIKVA